MKYFTHLKLMYNASMNKEEIRGLVSRKLKIRKRLIARRLELSEGEVSIKSLAITKKVIGSHIFSTKSRVSLYLPIKNEVETRDIINFFVEAGLEVYLPKYFKEEDEYRLARFGGWNNLEEGPYGIKQPAGDETIAGNKIDLAFVPGVGFDKKGVRLGYGKGVYDKLFAKSKATLAGLAYGFQVVDDLPREDHDLIMDSVVTDEEVYQF